MGSPVTAALQSAHKALDSANNFESSVKRQAGPPQAKPKSDYSHAREARKGEGEFMGVRANEAPELNTALDKRAEAKKVLEQ